MLLCLVVCGVDAATTDKVSVPTTEVASTTHEEREVVCALLMEKESDQLDAAREMGQWAMPSASVTLQGTAGRVVSLHTAWQRVVRMLGALLTGEASCSNGLTEALHHTLSTKRFHAGYYIYYRCQMRC
jgi:hypothetical protein